MGSRKRRRTATCDETSVTHKDYDTFWLWVITNAEERTVGPQRLSYWVVPMAQNALAAAVFEGHPQAPTRLKGVINHMLEAKKADGTYCTDLIPMKGRSQDRERRFSFRQDHDDILIEFDALDSYKSWDGLRQGAQRRSTEAVHDRQRYTVQQSNCMNTGDFEGFRLLGNAVEEIDVEGDVRPATVARIVAHFGGGL